MQQDSLAGFRLSPQQERLWLLQQGDANQPYRAQCSILIGGALDVEALRGALGQLAARFEVLRTTFRRLPELEFPLQFISDDADVSLPVYDMWDLDDERRDERLRVLAEELSLLPFDFENGPAAHFALAKLADDEHRLFITAHCLWADAASLDALFLELCRLYRGGPAPDAEPLQYAEIAEWQNELLAGEEAQVAREHWADLDLRLAASQKFPFEKRPGPGEGFTTGSVAVPFAPGTAARLDAAAARLGATPEDFLLACWLVLLGRLTGREEVFAGVASDGRLYEELAGAPGPLAKYLPVSARPAGGQSFRSVLEQAGRAAAEARQWQEGFAWPAEGPAGEQGPAYFASCFSYAGEPPPRQQGAGVTFTLESRRACFDRFKELLSCTRRGDTLRAEIGFDALRHTAESVRLTAAQFRALVESAIENPDASVETLELVDEGERRRLLVEFNADPAEARDARGVVELFEEQAARTPDREAVRFEGEALTYRRLNERANLLAAELRRAGVRPNDIVGLCLDRSADFIVGLLGVLKAGGAYAPFDTALPKERFAFLLEDTSAKVLLTHTRLLEKLPERTPLVLCLDEERGGAAAADAANPAAEATPGDLAYVLYTSGSTGRPKGVAVGRAQLANYTHAVRGRLGLEDGFSYALVSTFAADLGNTVIFPSLCFGGTLHVISHDMVSDPAALGQYLGEHPVDCVKIVPSHLSALLLGPRPEQVLPRRCLVLGGEATGWELVEKIRQLAPQCAVFNHYGPTETTVGVLVYGLGESEDERLSATLPLGRPLAGTEVYLLDRLMRPVPAGMTGEVYIGGAGLAHGYLRRPDTTAEKFIPHPFGRSAGARLYKTGDLARRLPGGDVEFLGRADHQVKVRGFRIELGEIEAALRECPAVLDARVVAAEQPSGDRRLVAYVVPDEARRPTAARHLRLRAEGYLNERHYHELPNGMGVLHQNKREIEFMYQEIFKEQIYLKHGVTLEDGACVFDVGANVGMMSLFVASQCADPVIYAFEPIPPTFEFLRLNTSLYGVDVKLFNCGLSDRAAEATFTHYPNLSLMSGRFADIEQDRAVVKAFERKQGGGARAGGGDGWNERLFDEMLTERLNGEQFNCQLRTISDVIREHGVERIDLLKIDVQKSEVAVVRGIGDSDWPKIRQVVLEVHDIDNRLEQIKALLEGHGFEVAVEQESMLENTRLYDLYAVRPEVKSAARRRRRDAATKPEWAGPQQFTAEVRGFLKDKLPEPMLPSAVVLLGALPLTPNGKIDYKALPPPEEAEAATKYNYVAPMTPVEEQLAEVWAEVLRVERVGAHDNFFELGGDSILSIQVIARAARRGIRLTPKLLFQHQTVSQLAAAASSAAPAPGAEQGAVSGPAPLTPIQRWFFAAGYSNPHRFNQAVLLEARRNLDAGALGSAARHLVRHHDALRLRFAHDGARWSQEVTRDEENQFFSHVRLDVDAGAAAAFDAAVEAEAERLQRSLNLERGPMLRVALFESRDGRAQRLLLVAHHLVVDGVSWRVLLEDLRAAYEQAEAGGALRLPAKTTSFKRWAELMADYARSPALREELGYWRGQAESARRQRLPVDYEGGENTEGKAREVVTFLDEELTRALLQEVPAAYHTQINDALVTASARAFRRWTGSGQLVLEMEGHGREELFDGADTTRTVGWFTSIYPVRVELGTEGDSVGEELKAVKEALRGVPGRGVGYGVLRYMGDEQLVGEELEGSAGVTFNYLGQFDQVLGEDGLWVASGGGAGAVRDAGERRARLLDINGSVVAGRLQINWTYGSEVHRRETIERLAGYFTEEVEAIVRHCREAGAGGYTPSDFPEANINQSELNELLAQLVEP